jgi:BASS family bile acid:Na+ symporter
LNVLAIGSILVVQFPQLLEIRARGYVGLVILWSASILVGGLLGGREAGLRRALSITTSLRNVSVALVIATGSFTGTAAITAVAAYGILSLIAGLLVALLWRCWPPISRIETGPSATWPEP